MDLTRRELHGPGTPETTWAACPDLGELDRWTPATWASRRVVVVAPHPDDEVLGAGGTSALLVEAGAELMVVAVTDGEASHPGQPTSLRRRRPLESVAAAAELGALPVLWHRLGLPDGGVTAEQVCELLGPLLHADDLLLAPWRFDGHPDHEAVGRGCFAAAHPGVELLSYVVWAWHWAAPEHLPWSSAVRVELGDEITQRKRRAVRCFHSQLEGADPILDHSTLAHLTRSYEVLFTR